MKTKKIDFTEMLSVLTSEIESIKKLSFLREDPFGVKRNFKISEISASLITTEVFDNCFKNGFLEEIGAYGVDTAIMSTVWIENDCKVFSMPFFQNEITTNPENLKIFFRGIINQIAASAIDNFFNSKVKNNKYSTIEKLPGEKYIQIGKQFKNISPKTVESVRSMGEKFYKNPRVVSVNTDCTVLRKTKIVADSMGTAIIESNDFWMLATDCQYISIKNTGMEPTVSKIFTSEKKLTSSFAEFEVEMLKAFANVHTYGKLESGVYPIIMDPSAVHTFFHEALGAHMFSGKYIVNDQSLVFKGKIGVDISEYDERFGALKNISIYNRPTARNMVASYKFDNEGIRAKDVCLLEKGVVRNFLTDRNSAKRLKKKPGGHALVENFCAMGERGKEYLSPEPRVSNLFIKSHVKLNIDELRAGVKYFCNQKGFPFYLEVSSKNGAVDVETGNFMTFLDNIKKVYLDGREENILAGTLTGDLFSFVSAIGAISNSYGEDIGFCGSSSGFVPTHGISPYMFFFGINFAPAKNPEKIESYNIKRDKYIPEKFI